jgi:tetratricopeptide (TPR) repeat protein
MHGDFDRARRLSAEARALLAELGPTVAGASTSLEASRVESLAGDLPAAELALRRDYDALAELGERYLLSTVAGELARVLYAQGRLDEAETCSRHAQELADPDDIASTTLWRTVQAKVLAHKGNRDAALILIGEGGRSPQAHRLRSFAQAETLVDLAEVLRLSGRRREADDVLEGAVELFKAKGNVAAVEALRVPAAFGP